MGLYQRSDVAAHPTAGASLTRCSCWPSSAADATQATDTTSLVLGQIEVILGTRLAGEAASAKSCGLAKELSAVVVDAQVELPKAGRKFPEPVAKLLNVAGQLATYGDQLTKSVCRVGK